MLRVKSLRERPVQRRRSICSWWPSELKQMGCLSWRNTNQARLQAGEATGCHVTSLPRARRKVLPPRSREEPRAMGTWRRLLLLGRVSLRGGCGAAVPPLGRRALSCGRQVCAERGRGRWEPDRRRLRAPASGSPRRNLELVVPKLSWAWGVYGVHLALLAWGYLVNRLTRRKMHGGLNSVKRPLCVFNNLAYPGR